MFLVHPVILAVVPILYLYSYNWGEVAFSDVLLPAALSSGFALVLLVVLRLALKDWRASAIIVSTVLALFFTHGRLVESLGGSAAVRIAGAVAYLAVLLAVCRLVVRKRGGLEKQTLVLNAVAGTLLLLTVSGIVMNAAKREPAPELRESEVTAAISSPGVAKPPPASLPDIYYIILDGYASSDSLEEFYGFDNGAFTDFLEEKGFFVAGESRSNYVQSRLSLASSLNLEYINFLTEDIGKNSRRAGVPNAMIEDNGLVRFLKSRGYRFVFFGSNWSGTRSNRNSDLCYIEGSWLKGEFMVALLKTTALRGLVEKEEGLYTRKGVLRAFREIPRVRGRLDGPVFVFAHIVPPHRPFLFGREGEPVGGNTNDWAEKGKYIDQLVFVNKKVRRMVDQILSNSERPPVIILQADHGPMPPGDPEVIARPDAKTARLRTGILNAYHLPRGEGSLYERISPVNSFRIVLNHLFGTGFDILEDRSYASGYARPYSFTDVTDLVDRDDGE